jgi:hypothetical protein
MQFTFRCRATPEKSELFKAQGFTRCIKVFRKARLEPEYRPCKGRKGIMKKLTFVGALLFACSVPTFAQLPDTSSSPAQVPDSQSPDKTKPLAQAPDSEKGAQSKADDARSKKTTMVGCISEHDGKYMLMTNNPSMSVELVSKEDLKAHIGHKVRVTGTISNRSSVGSDTGSPSTSYTAPESKPGDREKQGSPPGSHNSPNGQLKVTKMKMISQSCDVKKGKGSESAGLPSTVLNTPKN